METTFLHFKNLGRHPHLKKTEVASGVHTFEFGERSGRTPQLCVAAAINCFALLGLTMFLKFQFRLSIVSG